MKHLLKSCWKWILLLLFLFGMVHEIATMQERQPASKPAPLYDIAPDIVPVSAESGIFADLPADELDRITQI